MRKILLTAMITGLALGVAPSVALAKNPNAPGLVKKETPPETQPPANTPPGQAKKEDEPPPGHVKHEETGVGGGPVTSAAVFTPCAMSDIGLSSGSCFGWTEGNFNSGNAADKAFSANVINNLLGVTTFTGPTLYALEKFNVSGDSVDFSRLLTGLTVVAFHVGGAGGDPVGVGYQSTAWYAFDAGTTGIDILDFNKGGLSNARLFLTGGEVGVPEPATWALMIGGFGGAGAMLRRRRRRLA